LSEAAATGLPEVAATVRYLVSTSSRAFPVKGELALPEELEKRAFLRFSEALFRLPLPTGGNCSEHRPAPEDDPSSL
jgi:hypothetical protein